MKLFFAIGFFMTSQGFANSFVSLECKPKSPCLYAGKGLKYCVSKISVSGRSNGTGEEVISFSSPDIRQELKLVPQKSRVTFNLVANSVKFYSSDGDQWGELTALGSVYKGHITVDQDFQFQVVCQNKAFGFESTR